MSDFSENTSSATEEVKTPTAQQTEDTSNEIVKAPAAPAPTAEDTPSKPATQPRWKSWTMWLSVIGALWVIASAFGLPAKLGITDDNFKTVVNSIGTILVALGIVNNPSNPSCL